MTDRDRTESERRFRARLAAARREHVGFTALAALVSAVWVAGLAAAIAFGLKMGGARPGAVGAGTAAAVALFLAAGYWLSRRRRASGDWFAEVGGFGEWDLLVPFVFAIELPFLFLREVLTGPRMFASEPAIAAAVDVLDSGRARIDRRFLEEVRAARGEAARTAVRLLVEMKLCLAKGAGEDRYLILTIDGQAFVAGRGSPAGGGGRAAGR